MVVRLITQELCDDCIRHGMPDVPAVTEHILSIDGGPLRKVSLCGRCHLIWQPFITLYVEFGQEQPQPAPDKVQARQSGAKVLQLENTGTADEVTDGELICPLPHVREQGRPKRISYGNRGGHAKDSHNGLMMWQVVWGDPDGILRVPCRAHTECIEVGLSFTSKKGLGQHMRTCPLPRINEEGTKDTQEQEGDPQKSDAPAP